jgi:hypothetical protein
MATKAKPLLQHAFEQVFAKCGAMEELSAPNYQQPDTCAHLYYYLWVGLAAARI